MDADALVSEYLAHLRTYIEAGAEGFQDAAFDALSEMERIENAVGPRTTAVLQRCAVNILERVNHD